MIVIFFYQSTTISILRKCNIFFRFSSFGARNVSKIIPRGQILANAIFTTKEFLLSTIYSFFIYKNIVHFLLLFMIIIIF